MKTPSFPGARLLNAVGYQLVWIAAVAGAGAQQWWPGPAAALAFAIVTLAFGGKARADLRTLALALPMGFALDSAFSASGWMVYAQGWAWPWAWAAPLWIWAMWSAFALTLNHSLAFLGERQGLCALLGAVGGPLAYWTAAGAFDAVDFARPVAQVMIALSVAWGIVLPLLVGLNHRGSAALRWSTP